MQSNIMFNTRDLFPEYVALMLVLREHAPRMLDDRDAVLHVIHYYDRLDALWFRASSQLRKQHFLSDACVRRLFRTVPQTWLLRFLQGEEEIMAVTTEIEFTGMKYRTREQRLADAMRPVARPVLHLGEHLLYQVTIDDIDTGDWVQKRTLHARAHKLEVEQ